MRTKRTEDRYRKRARNLLKNCARTLGVESADDVSSTQFSQFLLNKFRGLAPASRRQYQSACKFLADERANDPAFASGGWGVFSALLVSDYLPMSPKSTRRTSSQKVKLITASALAALIAYLEGRHFRHRYALISYLQAGLATGLRPVEWVDAQLNCDGEWTTLTVRNAKYRHGERAHGEFRSLIWRTREARNEIAAVDRYLTIIALQLHGVPAGERQDMVERFNAALGALLRSVYDHLWKRRKGRIVLYSTRHTTAARLKSVRTPAEVAAQLGHLSDVSAALHYAQRARDGGSKLPDCALPVPDPSEVARVRSVSKDWRQIVDCHRRNRNAAPKI